MKYSLEPIADCSIHMTGSDKRLEEIMNEIRMTESCGFQGTLLYYQNNSLDPWIVASAILHNTEAYVPLIALQPYSMPPFTAAKLIHTMVALHRRRVDINMVTGGQPHELEQIGDGLDRAERYRRLMEYTEIVKSLLATNEPLTYEGMFYRYHNLSINTALSPEMRPRFFVACTSITEEGYEAAMRTGDVLVTFPGTVSQMRSWLGPKFPNASVRLGIRLGIVARPTAEEANRAIRAAVDFRLRQMRKQQMMQSGEVSPETDRVYLPRSGIPADCPYLVGGYDEVAAYLDEYYSMGVRILIVGRTRADEVVHYTEVFRRMKAKGEAPIEFAK